MLTMLKKRKLLVLLLNGFIFKSTSKLTWQVSLQGSRRARIRDSVQNGTSTFYGPKLAVSFVKKGIELKLRNAFPCIITICGSKCRTSIPCSYCNLLTKWSTLWESCLQRENSILGIEISISVNTGGHTVAPTRICKWRLTWDLVSYCYTDIFISTITTLNTYQ